MAVVAVGATPFPELAVIDCLLSEVFSRRMSSIVFCRLSFLGGCLFSAAVFVCLLLDVIVLWALSSAGCLRSALTVFCRVPDFCADCLLLAFGCLMDAAIICFQLSLIFPGRLLPPLIRRSFPFSVNTAKATYPRRGAVMNDLERT